MAPGLGYMLTVALEPQQGQQDGILKTVQHHLEGAYLKPDQAANASEMTVVMPVTDGASSKFPAMFGDLTKKKQELGIKTIGLSATTMDDVFVR